MTRTQFIQQSGATCRNWTWSWSFVNQDKKVVIFGAWDKEFDGNRTKILDDNWIRSSKGRRQPGYTQAVEHIRLIQQEGYSLQTFTMLYSNKLQDSQGEGPALIRGFEPVLKNRELVRDGNAWYAV
jgi:5-methylcytosine-specific restriction protein A